MLDQKIKNMLVGRYLLVSLIPSNFLGFCCAENECTTFLSRTSSTLSHFL